MWDVLSLKRVTLTAFALLPSFASSTTSAQRMYWIDENTIQRACLSGSPIRDLAHAHEPQDLALDLDTRTMYWTDRSADPTARFKRAKLDGSNVEVLNVDTSNPGAIALDFQSGKMYWIEGTSVIRRADLDGANTEDVLTGLEWAWDLALDVSAQKIYWTSSYYRKISRANVDGSGIEVLLTFDGSCSPREIALDPAAGKMYWTSQCHNSGWHYGDMFYANLDGSDMHWFGLGTDYPSGVALDLTAGKVYWGGGDYLSRGEIKRANLDGTDMEELVPSGLRYATGIALDTRPCGGPDCQPNGMPDDCDICNGTSQDCNTNDVPDECEPDCDLDGTPDACDPDCNGNDLSDVCDIFFGRSFDLLPPEGDGIPDECQHDCNGNLVPDLDDIASGSSQDCNENEVPDECDTAEGTSDDCNKNTVPDECEPDCNENEQADECDITTGASEDCNENAIPDECESDCNVNQVPDDCDIAAGTSEDDNGNGYPDECEAVNDSCRDALQIFAGETRLPGLRASVDGPPLDYVCYLFCDPWPCYMQDIWYDYVAPDSGRVDVIAVSDSGRDLSVVVYKGCTCPVYEEDAVGCGLWGPVAFMAEVRNCYKLQVQGATDATGAGTLTLETEFPDPCPEREPLLIFVDRDASPGGDGASWLTAFDDLQKALAAVTDTENEVIEIRVAEGMYTPVGPGGDRQSTFLLPRCLTITGGYAGFGAPDPNERDWAAHETILSGDLNGDDPDEINSCCYAHRPGGCDDSTCEAAVCLNNPSCCDSYWLDGCVDLASEMCGGLCANFSENSYHVVTISDADDTVILDGLTITGGNADGSFLDDQGAGIQCSWSSPTLRNCRITRNRADESGAGVYDCDGPIKSCEITGNAVVWGSGAGLEGCDGMILDCTVSGNYARYGAGLHDCGGGISECTIIGNSADISGGGLSECDGTIERCVISRNVSWNAGGGVYGCGGEIRSCVISGNAAELAGGGLSYCDASIINCTITGNITTNLQTSGAIAYCSGPIIDCVFSENGITWSGYSTSPTFSCLPPEALPGQTNVAADPKFATPGYWGADGAWVEGDYRLSAASPCINAGDPAFVSETGETDLDGHPRVLCGRVDIGAYEFGIGDFTCDQLINLADYASWAACMTGPNALPCPDGCRAFDFEFDGDVDLQDFAGFQEALTGP